MKKISALLIGSVSLLLVTLLCGCQAENASSENSTVQQVDYAGIVRDISTVQAFTGEAVSEDDINAIVMAGVNAPSAMNGQPWHFSVITDQDTLAELAGGMSFGGMTDGTPPADLTMPEGMEKPEGVPEELPESKELPEGMKMPEGMPGDLPEDLDLPEGMPENMPEKPADASAAPAMDFGSTSGAKAGMGDAPLVIVISCKEGSELDAGLATQNMSAEAQLLGYGTKIISSPKMTLNQDTYKEMLSIPEDMSVVCVLLIGRTDTANYDVVSGATTRNSVDEIVSYIK